MPSKGKVKGSQFERDIAAILTKNGLPSKRVVLSGSHPDHPGDVLGEDGTLYELKKRENISMNMWKWLEPVDYLIIARNRQKPLVVMDLDQYIELRKKK